MQSRDARGSGAFAGEMSGHIVLSDAWHGADDALYVALVLLQVLSRSGWSLAKFRRALPMTVATPEIRLSCDVSRKHAIVAEVASRVRGSGADVDTTRWCAREHGSWLVVAASLGHEIEAHAAM